MNSISIETILTIVYVQVDDWYQEKGCLLLSGKTGRKPIFSDSEVMTLMISQEFVPYPAETQYLAYIRSNYGYLFPRLLDQSQFNRRARGLRSLLEAMRRDWVLETGIGQAMTYLIDTKPIPVMGYKRSKTRSDFRGSADYGYCVSRNLHYYGYKLVMLSSCDGLPIAYELVPANVDERQAAEAIIDAVMNVTIIGDKGFVGVEWQSQMYEQTGNLLLTPKRKNQKIQHPAGVQATLNAIRERIEGVFHELQNTGRNIERLLAKTVVGLTTRLIAKVTAHLLKRLLYNTYHIDIQTFQCSHDF